MSAVELVIDGRARDLGGFAVRRVLPVAARRLVGPFVFLDHMGPAEVPQGMDVGPHPHIGLATVTYLFEGEIVHRDSLGSLQTIRPGDVNWMTAGRGIVHSERTAPGARRHGARLDGLQIWIALPREHEEAEPAFHHHPAASLPTLERDGVRLRLIAGSAYGLTSPVAVFSPLFYVDAAAPAGTRLEVPPEHVERALYVVSGEIDCGGVPAAAGRMLVLAQGAEAAIVARTEARVVLLGGASIDGERHIFWNFVSSSRERIERAKDDWRNDRFPRVPGDDGERVPLPG